MGLKSFLQKTGFVEGEDIGQTPISPTPTYTPQDYKTTSLGGYTPQPQPQSDVNYDTYFDKLMDEANLPGPDFYEFILALREMTSIPVESDKYRLVFTTFKAVGVKKEVLLSSAEQYLSVLDKDAQIFDNEVNAEISNLNSKQERVRQIDQEIQALNDKLRSLSAEKDAINVQVSTGMSKIESHKISFKNALSKRKQEIATQINNIKTYING